MGRFVYSQSWSNQVTYVLSTDIKGIPQVKHGLHPTQLQPQDHLARNLFERPDDVNPTIQQWLTVEDPDGKKKDVDQEGWSHSKICTI
eukprot:6555015-Prorocentrum_lima.AAC.1